MFEENPFDDGDDVLWEGFDVSFEHVFEVDPWEFPEGLFEVGGDEEGEEVEVGLGFGLDVFQGGVGGLGVDAFEGLLEEKGEGGEFLLLNEVL